jgi:sulfur relay (sulfurtransferase) DsrC/TusE family protein
VQRDYIYVFIISLFTDYLFAGAVKMWRKTADNHVTNEQYNCKKLYAIKQTP